MPAAARSPAQHQHHPIGTDLVRHCPRGPLHPGHHLLLLIAGRALPQQLRALLGLLQRAQLARVACDLRARLVVPLRAQPDEGVPAAPEPPRPHLREKLRPPPAHALIVRQRCARGGARLPLVRRRQVLVVADAVDPHGAAAAPRQRVPLHPRGQHDKRAQQRRRRSRRHRPRPRPHRASPHGDPWSGLL